MALFLLPAHAAPMPDNGPGGSSIQAANKKVKSNTVIIRQRISSISSEPPLFDLPRVDAGEQQVLEAGSAPRVLNGIPFGGTWSGLGVSPAGVFTPSACGSFRLLYEVPGLGRDSVLCTVLNGSQTSNPVSISGPAQICAGNGPVTFTAQPSGGTWAASLPANGVFNPTGFSGNELQIQYSALVNGCNLAQVLTVPVYPASLSLSSGGQTDLCLNQSLQLQFSPLPAGNHRIRWYRNGTLLVGDTLPSLETSTAGSYRAGLLLRNPLGDSLCAVFSQAISLSNSGSTAPAAPQLRRDSAEIVMDNYSGTNGFTWFLNGEEITGASGSSFTPQISGIYHATRNEGNCTSDFSNGISFQVGTVTAAGSVSRGKELRAYPNPVTRFLSFRDAPQVFSVHLRDVLGRNHLLHPDQDGRLDLQEFPAGVYSLELISSEGGSSRIRLLKK